MRLLVGVRATRAVAFVLALAGCATAPPLPLYRGRVPSGDVGAIAAYLGAMRGVAPGRPVVAEKLPDAEFLRRLHAQDVCGDGARGNRGVGAIWTAFGLTPSEAEAERGATQLLDAGVTGFYDVDTKHLVVRESGAGRMQNALTIPHEIEHALQDQRVGLRTGCDRDADGRIARRALFEGDATVTSAAYEARHRGETDAHAIARVAKRLAALSDAELAKAIGGDLPLKAPQAMREMFAWPYTQGSVFVAQLYRAGGWPLVDAALARPPWTSEQVLHPEKYVAGEGPIDVALPEPPDGARGVARGRMGELQTGMFLGACMPLPAAKAAASGWGGDAYMVVDAPGTGRLLLWSTAWDDEAAAGRFAAAVDARRACAAPGVAKTFAVARQGTRVAYVQGVDGAAAAPLATKLLALVGRAPPRAPPIGDVTLPPPTYHDVDYEGLGKLEGGRYENAFLGLSADVSSFEPAPLPERVDLRGWGLELLVTRNGGAVGMRFVWAPISSPLMESETSQWVESIRKSAGFEGLPVYDVGRAPLHLSFAEGDMRMVRFGDHVEGRVALVPMCEGRMTLILDLLWSARTGSYAAIQQMLASLRRIGASDPPMCAAVRGAR